MKAKLVLTLFAAAGLGACDAGNDQNQQSTQQQQRDAATAPGAQDQGTYNELGTTNLTTDASPLDVDVAVNQVDDANEINTTR